MDRVFLNSREADQYFLAIKKDSGIVYSALADEFGVSSRTLRDWKRGTYSFPLQVAKKVEKEYKIALPKNAIVIKESTLKSQTGDSTQQEIW